MQGEAFPIKRLAFFLFVSSLIVLAALKPLEAGSRTVEFVNPISDICWDCIFPISVGSTRIFADRPDPPKPGNILYNCLIPV